MSAPLKSPAAVLVDTELFKKLALVVSEATGVQLGDRQAAMVESRIRKRMFDLHFKEAQDYLGYLEKNKISETKTLVSLLTTHHTYFFREFPHFEYLEREGLRRIVEAVRKRGDGTIRVWSAGCSRGQEVYSISMFLRHHLKMLASELKFEILGSDVDPESIAYAKNGVYRWDEIKEVPLPYLSNHWVRGTGEITAFVKAKESIKSACKFETTNLLDLPKQSAGTPYDIIFCRNVFIYFDSPQIRATTLEFLKRLAPQGIFFTGIAESLFGLELPVHSCGPSIYEHTAAAPAPEAKVKLRAVAEPKRVRVFCVDDSPTILALLKKILTTDTGFEVVGTASDGLEASEKLAKLQADVMTLDIHMPRQTGIEYLEKNMKLGHPPVVMMTSVSREDASLGIRTLELGARDFIEKPTLTDLAQRADEIRVKLRCAVAIAKSTAPSDLELERSFKRDSMITSPEDKLRIVLASPGDLKKIEYLLGQFKGPQPATLVFMPGSDKVMPSLAERTRAPLWPKVTIADGQLPKLEPGRLFWLGFGRHFDELKRTCLKRKVSLLILGDFPQPVLEKVCDWPDSQVVLEDLGLADSEHHHVLGKVKNRTYVPATSFGYVSQDFLSRG